MVNMMGNKKILSLIVITSIILAGIAISFYKIPNADAFGSSNNDTNSYTVDWGVEEGLLISHSDYASKDSNYEKTVSFDTPNLREISFILSWTDDKTTFLGRLGLDTLTLEITTPDGNKIVESARSARKTKQGNIEITLPVNNFNPTTLTLESENIMGVEKQLKDKYFDYTWVNKEFTIKVSVQVGEIRPLKRLADNGNDFDLEIRSSNYHTSTTADDTVLNSDNGDSYIETGNYPPDDDPFACNWCGESHGHSRSCPYYDDPFDCNWCGERFGHRPSCPHYDDPFEDDPNYQGNTLDKPWKVFLAIFFFLFPLFFQSMLIF